MNVDEEIQTLYQALANAGLSFLKKINYTQEFQFPLGFPWLQSHFDFQQLNLLVFHAGPQLLEKYRSYLHAAYHLTESYFTQWAKGETLPHSAKRFSNDTWGRYPLFHLFSHHYELARVHLNACLTDLPSQDHALKKRLGFFLKQIISAWSPANFLASNPELLQDAFDSQGRNILRGMKDFIEDLDVKAPFFNLKMVDENAFVIGQTLAATPGDVIFRNNMMELIQYQPQTTTIKCIPLLIIPPWINKYYILDLSPSNSFVGWLLKQGIVVFILSWFNPKASDKEIGWNDYLEQGPLAAIPVIQKQLKVSTINALGFCIGGTLLAYLLAYLSKTNNKLINSATFLASMIDFSDAGELGAFINEADLLALEQHTQATGVFSGPMMKSVFNALKADDLIWSFFVSHYLQGKKPKAFDLLYWNNDCTNLPAKMHKDYLAWMYLENALIIPNKLQYNDTPLDVHGIITPSFFIATEQDHIAPWKTIYLGYKSFSGPKNFLLGGSGHIAGIINAPQFNKYGYYHYSKACDNPEQWLAKACYVPGSWWPQWCEWLMKHSGSTMPVYSFADLIFPSLSKAPGEYVFKSAIDS